MLSLFFLCTFTWSQEVPIVVGSKAFTESYILAEIAAKSLETIPNVKVEKRLGIGGTGLVVEALESGKIDVYPEYTGTIAQTILKRPELKEFSEIQAELKKRGLQMSEPLGFENSYVIALSKEASERFRIQRLSELAQFPQIRLGLSSEYFSRSDGYPLLVKILNFHPATPPIVMSHELAYNAIEAGKIDAMDVYSTDANIDKVGLQALEDDVRAAPKYQAVFLARTSFIERCPQCWRQLQASAGKISEGKMRRLNMEAQMRHEKLKQSPLLILRLKEHLVLVSIAFLFAVLVGIPLGFLGFHYRFLSQFILGISGLIQTVPSLALFCLLIPLFGIGQIAAIVALCLYALLPVVANTVVGLQNIDPLLFEVSDALCLSRRQRLLQIELPLASRSIWSGLKTSTIITIGTATLAALIGAGGLGAPIVEGLALNNMNLVLSGAVPSALLALFTHFLFDFLERWVVPRGLRP
jgi:osmoprotectant transport system permease protein